MGGKPEREPAFAAKFVRALVMGQVSSQYGHTAMILLTTLAGWEEGIHGNPEWLFFYLDPLADLCGMRKKALIEAIKRLRGSGWLEYHAGTKGVACRFRIEIPDSVRQMMNLRCLKDTESEPNRNRKGVAYIPTPTPTPKNPLPPTADAVTPPADSNGKPDSGKKKTRKTCAPDFSQFYVVYPLKKAKIAAAKAYPRAIKTVMKDHGLSPDEAHRFLIDRANDYATEVRGCDRSKIKHPATWLNAGCWDDEPTNGKPQPFKLVPDLPRR